MRDPNEPPLDEAPIDRVSLRELKDRQLALFDLARRHPMTTNVRPGYLPGRETAQRLHALSQHGVSLRRVEAATGVSRRSLSRIKTGAQTAVAVNHARSVEAFYADTFGRSEPIADVITTEMKTGPQLNAARAESRHSLVNAAISMQKVARQLRYVDPRYLKFSDTDQELQQAPTIITDAITSIITHMKEIQHVQSTVR